VRPVLGDGAELVQLVLAQAFLAQSGSAKPEANQHQSGEGGDEDGATNRMGAGSSKQFRS